MTRALLIVDVQNDFTEFGALAVTGGDRVAATITRFLSSHAADYLRIVASRDWHDPDSDNGGHFSASPDFIDTWPAHCVRATTGAEYDELLSTTTVTDHVMKGQGSPAYSMFEGTTAQGETTVAVLRAHGIDEVDVVGIATDHCVRATVLDALREGMGVRVLEDMTAGVGERSTAAARSEMIDAGAVVLDSAVAFGRSDRQGGEGSAPEVGEHLI